MIRRLFLIAVVVQTVLLLIVGAFLSVPASTVQGYIRNEAHRSGARRERATRPSKEEMDAYVRQFPRVIYDGKKKRCEESALNCLIFMHIGKSGGESFHEMASKIANRTGRVYEGGRHFDWSFINALGNNSDVILMLRHPVSRAVSHFHYVQEQPWGPKELRNMTLTDYFRNKTFMLDTRDIWQDGQASVSWLTGTHLAKWVGTPPHQVNKRERLSTQNISMLLHLAADRLESTLWFGILEDIDRSLELLQFALKLPEKPVMRYQNAARKLHEKPTQAERATLATLVPQDLWLYEYGLELFEARWHAYKTGIFVQPNRPPIPDLSCISFRFNLSCSQGPLQGTYYFPQ